MPIHAGRKRPKPCSTRAAHRLETLLEPDHVTRQWHGATHHNHRHTTKQAIATMPPPVLKTMKALQCEHNAAHRGPAGCTKAVGAVQKAQQENDPGHTWPHCTACSTLQAGCTLYKWLPPRGPAARDSRTTGPGAPIWPSIHIASGHALGSVEAWDCVWMTSDYMNRAAGT